MFGLSLLTECEAGQTYAMTYQNSLGYAAGLSEEAEQASVVVPDSVQAIAAGSECFAPLPTARMRVASSAGMLQLLDPLL